MNVQEADVVEGTGPITPPPESPPSADPFPLELPPPYIPREVEGLPLEPRPLLFVSAKASAVFELPLAIAARVFGPTKP